MVRSSRLPGHRTGRPFSLSSNNLAYLFTVRSRSTCEASVLGFPRTASFYWLPSSFSVEFLGTSTGSSLSFLEELLAFLLRL